MILQLEEFDEQQKTTQADEMCKDLKLIVNTVTMLEQSMQVFQKSCQEVMEKALQSMQKKIDELAQKLIEYMPQPTLQPFSPPQAQVYNVMQPATLFHSVPPASSHHVNESPMGQSAPIPIAPLSTKYNEMSATEISKEKLKTIAETLQKFSSLCTESKIGVLAVILAREAIFGDDVLRRCTPSGWCNMPALPQAELNLLKCTLFEQFPREDLDNCTRDNCPSVQETAEKTMRVTYAYTGVLILRAYVHFFHYCPVIYVLFAVSCVQKGMYKKPFILCRNAYTVILRRLS